MIGSKHSEAAGRRSAGPVVLLCWTPSDDNSNLKKRRPVPYSAGPLFLSIHKSAVRVIVFDRR